MKSVSNGIEISINFQFSNQFSTQFEKNSYRFSAQFCPKPSEKLFPKSLLFLMNHLSRNFQGIFYIHFIEEKENFLNYQKNYQILFRYQMIYYPKKKKKLSKNDVKPLVMLFSHHFISSFTCFSKDIVFQSYFFHIAFLNNKFFSSVVIL